MKTKKFTIKPVLLSVMLLSIFSFLFLQNIEIDSSLIQGQVFEFSSEAGNFKNYIPDLFILDNLAERLKEIITVDF